MSVILIILGVIFGGIRPFIRPRNPDSVDVYKALAHVYVGICMGGWIYAADPVCMWLAIVLSTFETVCAVGQRIGRK